MDIYRSGVSRGKGRLYVLRFQKNKIKYMKILIADDHTIVREGIIRILKEAFPFAEITDVCDSVDLMKHVLKGGVWDVIICEYQCPVIRMAIKIRSILPFSYHLSMHALISIQYDHW